MKKKTPFQMVLYRNYRIAITLYAIDLLTSVCGLSMPLPREYMPIETTTDYDKSEREFHRNSAIHLNQLDLYYLHLQLKGVFVR